MIKSQLQVVPNTNNSSFSILDQKYVLLNTIDKGSTCKVKLARDIKSQVEVAIKILDPAYKEKSLLEMKMLEKVKHPNVIKMIEEKEGTIRKPDGRSKDVNYIVLEYAKYGSLFDFVYFPQKGFGEKMGRAILKQLIEGLQACHEVEVVHRDIKTENVMLNSKFQVKLADFGYGKNLQGDKGDFILHTMAGTIAYMAPEVLTGNYIGDTADIFSCGATLFVVVTGNMPLRRASLDDDRYQYFIKNKKEKFWKNYVLTSVSEEFKSLINSMLSYDPSERPSLDDILSHPWMKMEYPSYDEYFADFEKRKLEVLKAKKLTISQKAKTKMTKKKRIYRADEDEEIPWFTGNRKISEFIENEFCPNPYSIKLTGDSYVDILNYLADYFAKEDKIKKEIKANEKSAKFVVDYYNGDNSSIVLQIEVELKSTENEEGNDDYVAEFRKIIGDKAELFNIYNEFVAFCQKEAEAETDI
jgi:serine/threonine protein kinase